MEELSALRAFASSLGVGLLMGLERERRPGALAGLRTFALAGVAGAASALLAQQAGMPWLLPTLLLALAATMAAAELRREPGAAPDATTTIALLLCVLYGAMLWHGHARLTVALALATTALLHFKAELQDASRRISRRDLVSFLQFGAIAGVVLPALPNQGYGPYSALNPHEIWLMVVLVAGVGLCGYVALRLAGPSRGPILLGVLGGLVSSTATTLVFARRAREGERHAAQALTVILTANLVLLLRIGFMTAVVAPAALPALLPVLGLAFLAGSVIAAWLTPQASPAAAAPAELSNPLELLPALGFGAVYGAAVLLTAWIDSKAGHVGVYALAPVLGLTDMDAIALSTLRLFEAGSLTAPQLGVTLMLAIVANLAFKATLALVLGNRSLAWRVAAGFAAVLAGLGAGNVLLRMSV